MHTARPGTYELSLSFLISLGICNATYQFGSFPFTKDNYWQKLIYTIYKLEAKIHGIPFNFNFILQRTLRTVRLDKSVSGTNGSF